MLINALCEYYEELEKQGRMVPEGYSRQGVHYLISLTPEGNIDGVIDWQIRENIPQKNGKVKEVPRPRSVLLPLRTEKSVIDSNIIEHRPLYIFGLNYDANAFTSQDKTRKAEKSHEAFRKANLDFIEGLHSPIISAYRNFLLNWVPEEQTENPYLKDLGKAYKTAYFAFCLSGRPDILLHEDPLIRQKWESSLNESVEDGSVISQCAVTGETSPIARIHNKIKGVPGGQASGTVLVGFKYSSGWSYGHKESYNSNISENAMKRYSFALNTLLADRNHRQTIDDITVIYWASGGDEECVDFLNAFLFGSNEKTTPEQVDQMLGGLFGKVREGAVTEEKLRLTDVTDENVNFYILGMKPNAARLSVKFFYRRRLGQILSCVAQHQKDMQIGGEVRAVPLWRLKNELKSPKSGNEQIDASLLAAIFQSIVNGTPYPVYLLSTLVMRIKTDRSINSVRAGAVRACINRYDRIHHNKEELTMALDKQNTNQAYLCGRLFAVLQKIQENAAGGAKLNRTIKDSYFASAASKPALVFPKLLTLSQNHMKKLSEGRAIYFNKLVEEIIGKLSGEFPDTLLLTEQGKFMIGYYQQDQDFYTKNSETTKED